MRQLLNWAVLLSIFVPGLARAQSAPASASAPATMPVLGQSFKVERFVIDGNTAFTDAELQPLLKKYVGQDLTFELIDDARRKITDFYISKGYITSGAILPEQEIVAGTVWIHVVEGKLERLDIAGNKGLQRSYFSDRLERSLKPPLKISAIKDALEILQQDPRIGSIQGRLLPGTQPGLAVLDLNVQENRPYQIGIQVDNGGTPSTGAERVAMVGSDLNLTGVGDTLFMRWGPVAGGTADPEFAPANDILAEYTRPIIGDRTSLIFFYARNELSLIEPPLSTLGSDTVSDSAAISLEQALIRTPTSELNVQLSLSRRDNHTKLLGQNFSFADGAVDGWMTSTAIRSIVEWTTRSDTYVISARSTLSVGLDWLGSTIHSDGEADSHFVSWLGETQQAWRIEPIGAVLLTRAGVQLADDRLLAVEQFGLGGFETVRGYRESTLLTDDAALASAEIRHSLVPPEKWLTIDGALFADVGYGWQHGDSSHGTLLASVGCGLLYTITSHVEGEIYFGVPLCNKPEGDNLQDRGVYFRVLVKAF